MKKTFSFLFVVCLLFSSLAVAESTTSNLPDIGSLTVEQLIALKESVNDRLIELGALYEKIAKGAEGENVLLLQKRLAELGYLAGEPSGTWDKASMDAMKVYEKATGVKKPDGIATIAEQEALYDSNAPAKPTPPPKPTPKPKPTPDPRKTYGKFDFKAVSRNPEKYVGTKAKITGRVLQVMGSRTEGFDIRLATKGRYDNVIYVYIAPENTPSYNVLEDDKITIYCALAGDYTYTSTLGAAITLPLVNVDFLEMAK